MSTSSTPTCTVIHPKETYEGKQGLSYFTGISAKAPEPSSYAYTCWHFHRRPGSRTST